MMPTDVTDTANGAKPKGRLAIWIGIVLAALLAVMIGVRVKQSLAKRAAVAEEGKQAQAASAQKAPIKIAHPTPATLKPRIEITGTLQPWRYADVGFEQSGRLARVLVTTGDRVKEGQVLAYLDSSIASAQVGQAEAQARAAEANLALAEDNLRRTKSLVDSHSIPEAQLTQAQSQVDLAKAQLEGARASERLARTGAGQRSITAPFAGLITKTPSAVGGVVQPGAPLIKVEDLSRFRLSASIGEEVADLVKLGLDVEVRYRDRTVTGKVMTLVPSLDQNTRRAPIEIEVANDPKDPLLAWSFVRATIRSDKDISGLRIPQSARRPGAQNEVFIIKDGKLVAVRVAATTDTDGTLIVREGLTADDVVVLTPDADMKSGDPAPRITDK